MGSLLNGTKAWKGEKERTREEVDPLHEIAEFQAQRSENAKSVRGEIGFTWLNVKGSVTYIIIPRECDFHVDSNRRGGRSINIPKRNSDQEFSEMSSVRTKEHALDLVAQVSSIYVYEFLRFP